MKYFKAKLGEKGSAFPTLQTIVPFSLERHTRKTSIKPEADGVGTAYVCRSTIVHSLRQKDTANWDMQKARLSP